MSELRIFTFIYCCAISAITVFGLFASFIFSNHDYSFLYEPINLTLLIYTIVVITSLALHLRYKNNLIKYFNVTSVFVAVAAVAFIQIGVILDGGFIFQVTILASLFVIFGIMLLRALLKN